MSDPTRERRRFNAYYYSFTATGNLEIDQILMAVARAGKAFHSTDQWSDGTPSHADLSQKAADHAALHPEAEGGGDE